MKIDGSAVLGPLGALAVTVLAAPGLALWAWFAWETFQLGLLHVVNTTLFVGMPALCVLIVLGGSTLFTLSGLAGRRRRQLRASSVLIVTVATPIALLPTLCTALLVALIWIFVGPPGSVAIPFH
jgi:hypothetical protein